VYLILGRIVRWGVEVVLHWQDDRDLIRLVFPFVFRRGLRVLCRSRQLGGKSPLCVPLLRDFDDDGKVISPAIRIRQINTIAGPGSSRPRDVPERVAAECLSRMLNREDPFHARITTDIYWRHVHTPSSTNVAEQLIYRAGYPNPILIRSAMDVSSIGNSSR
jgi:hypothetical protein